MSKSLVLLSGGQDSTTVLHLALRDARNHASVAEARDHVVALSMYYGQRHAHELDAAQDIARAAGVKHRVLDISNVYLGSASALVDMEADLTVDGGLRDKEAPNGLPSSFVPGRNLLFFAVAASFAGVIGADRIYTGVCQTDYSGYPDCRAAFVEAMTRAIYEAWPSGEDRPQLVAPLMTLTKAETVALARELGPECWAALALSVTCYNGQRPGCGACASCDLRAKGFAAIGETDPATTEPRSF